MSVRDKRVEMVLFGSLMRLYEKRFEFAEHPELLRPILGVHVMPRKAA